jgi:hypothetical protein
MTLALFNALLMVVGPFMFIGLLAIPVLVQWPVRPSQAAAQRRPARTRVRRPVYRTAVAW